MTPQDVYSILEEIAEIHGCTDKLKLIPLSEDDVAATDIAEYIEEHKKKRLDPLAFSLYHIPIGATI